jgi:hypothetical protein
MIAIGITDGINTELSPGQFGGGAKVVTDETDADDKKKGKLF